MNILTNNSEFFECTPHENVGFGGQLGPESSPKRRHKHCHGISLSYFLRPRSHSLGPLYLRHPNPCVANLLGEVCPIFQKFSDFSLFFGGRLKRLCLHESWRERRDAWKMEYAGAVHCVWHSLRAHSCIFGQLARLGARSAPGSPKQKTKRSD